MDLPGKTDAIPTFEQLLSGSGRGELLDTFGEKLAWYGWDSRLWILLTGGTLIVLAIYVTLYFLNRYRPQTGSLMLRKPPYNLSAPAIRYISQRGYDTKSVVISLLDAALKGCYKITWRRSGFQAERTPHANFELLNSIERDALASSKFHYWERVAVGSLSNGVTRRVGEKLDRNLKRSYSKLFKKNRGWIAGLILGSLATLFAVFSLQMDGITLKWFGAYLFIFGAFIVLPMIFLLQVIKDRYWYGIFYAALFMVIGTVTLVYLDLRPGTPLFAPAILPLAVINFTFHRKISGYTKKGRAVMDRIHAYQNYLDARFDHYANGMLDIRDLAEDIPYALALDIEDKMTNYFRPMLSRRKFEPYQIFDKIMN